MDVTPDLPAELRNKVDHLSLDGVAGPAGLRLLDERERQRPVGLIAGSTSDTPLMGSLFYLRRALQPTAELREGDLDTLLSRPLSVIIAPDGTLGSPDSRKKVEAWIRAGGTLIRFAGPLLIQGPEKSVGQDHAPADALLPVPLMGGERVLGAPCHGAGRNVWRPSRRPRRFMTLMFPPMSLSHGRCWRSLPRIWRRIAGRG